MNQIKLVIWDLDETFWNGTLSEGEVIPVPENVELVKILTERGIINSISSKNDLEPVKEKLQELGVWDYFVFPIINWNPKGENVREIISQCQLRPTNVLFIDDNPMNLKEVEHYNPQIQTLMATELDGLLDDEGLKGKDDSTLSRLKQYKILEEKAIFKTSCSNNRDFLLKSNICISFFRDIESSKTRIAELIARSNQLNYTKVRIGEDELTKIAQDPNIEAAAINVVDNFGNYGICGFYALNKENRKLIHFLFSCRILNLGVESFVYQKLGCPVIDIVEPVSANLDTSGVFDWIHVVEEPLLDMSQSMSASKKTRIMLVGGCDLDQLCHYIDKNDFEVLTDFNYVNQAGLPVHREHTCYLRMHGNVSNDQYRELLKLPFLDENFLNFQMYSQPYDILVFSVLMNYDYSMYRNKKYGCIIACGGWNNIMNEEWCDVRYSPDQIASFRDQYEYIGHQSPADFWNDLEYLLTVTNKQIVFLNGSEVKMNSSEPESKNEEGVAEHHKKMNAVLDAFVLKHADRCKIVDVRRYVKDVSDVKENIRHYQRIHYVELAYELMRICNFNRRDLIFMYKMKLNIRKLKRIYSSLKRRFLFPKFME